MKRVNTLPCGQRICQILENKVERTSKGLGKDVVNTLRIHDTSRGCTYPTITVPSNECGFAFNDVGTTARHQLLHGVEIRVDGQHGVLARNDSSSKICQ